MLKIINKLGSIILKLTTHFALDSKRKFMKSFSIFSDLFTTGHFQTTRSNKAVKYVYNVALIPLHWSRVLREIPRRHSESSLA